MKNEIITNQGEIGAYIKAGTKFEVLEDLEQCKDSLLFDSDVTVARLELGSGYAAALEVCGEVRIIYNEDEVYKLPSKFPQALKDMIATGEIYDNENVVVDNNNWFSLVYFKGGNAIDDFPFESDISKMSKEELYGIMCAETEKFFAEELNNTYGCDKCGERHNQDENIIWITSSYGVCEACYNALSKEELEEIRAKYE